VEDEHILYSEQLAYSSMLRYCAAIDYNGPATIVTLQGAVARYGQWKQAEDDMTQLAGWWPARRLIRWSEDESRWPGSVRLERAAEDDAWRRRLRRSSAGNRRNRG
jgi:hypothetical protein